MSIDVPFLFGIQLRGWQIKIESVDRESLRFVLEESLRNWPAWRRETDIRLIAGRVMVMEELSFPQTPLEPLWRRLAMARWDATMLRLSQALAAADNASVEYAPAGQAPIVRGGGE